MPLVSLFLALLFAQDLGGGAVDAGPKVTIEGSVSKRTGEQVEGIVLAHINAGWHINSAKPLDEFAIPTVLELDNAQLVNVQYPQHELHAFGFSGGKQIAVYQGTIQIPFTAKVTGDRIEATLRYQSCNDNVCLPPNTAKGVISASVVAPVVSPGAASFTPLSAAPKNAVKKDRLATAFESRGLPLTLGLIFLAGLALNLTPCVFPLIPITAGFFAMQSDGR
ncbi:MAG TPA: protein-disulfide reductase DsbD domain-containing protein, partial [Thermoanaerobaculia bacterium]|nr:protein-disulfide reductase DsbD domain-containing protein [Thermoanaerobaculia bacterium]